MKSRCLNVNDSAIPSDKIMVMLSIDTNPVKEMMKDMKEKGLIIDLTRGKTTKSIILLTDGRGLLSTTTVETLSKRYNKLEL